MRISDWSSDVCSSDLIAHTDPAIIPLDGTHHVVYTYSQCLGFYGVYFKYILGEVGVEGGVGRCDFGPFSQFVDKGVGNGAEIPHRPAHAVLQDKLERSEEHTSELQSLMRISYAVFCLK